MANSREQATSRRKIEKIILHCSATREGQDIGINTIRQWHLARGWKDVGYHWVVKIDGTAQAGRPESSVGSHTKDHNATSIGICYVGGVMQDGKTAKDTMTKAQEYTVMKLINDIRARYGWVPVHGHNEFANKACPSFVVAEKYPDLNNKPTTTPKPKKNAVSRNELG